MLPKSFRVTGIILSRQNVGEADKLVVAFTKELGKLRFKATGIRRLNSKRAPHLELFNEVDMQLHLGRGMPVVTEAKLISSFSNLKTDLTLSAYSFYLVEVVDKIIPDNQPHVGIYQEFVITLTKLDEKGVKKDNAMRVIKEFILYLLRELGYLARGQIPPASLTEYVESVVEKRIRSKKFIDEI